MATGSSEQAAQRTVEFRKRIMRVFPEETFVFEAKRYPQHPGCYLMKDRRGTVIYVGKAKNLRDRLSSYFHSRPRERRLERMIQRVADIEVFLVNSEYESLVLENNLIKRYKPRYNRRLKADDSGYFYIVQTSETYPRLLPYMRDRWNKEIERLGGQVLTRRFGPYISRLFRDILLEYVNDSFGIRTCSQMPRRVCLRYEIKRCSGVCEGLESREAYAARLEEAAVFLSYEQADIVEHTIEEMQSRMEYYSGRLEFECAQRVRDQITAVKRLRLKQIVERDLPYDQDVVVFGTNHVLVMEVKRGIVMGLRVDPLVSGPAAKEQFLTSTYRKISPAELILNMLPGGSTWQQALSTENGNPVRIIVPTDGIELGLLELGVLNLQYRTGDQPA